MKEIVSFPHMGHYSIPITSLFQYIFPHFEIRKAPPITKRTLELGARHSPDFICVPFKYNMGCFIEALEGGATMLIQAGGGCRYGYYGEIQEQILRDLGYDFKFVQFLAKELSFSKFCRMCIEMGTPRSRLQILRRLVLAIEILLVMDRAEKIVGEKMPFVSEKDALMSAFKRFITDLERIDSFPKLYSKYRCFRKQVGKLHLKKPRNHLKVGIIGELYAQMEPFASFFIERELAEKGIAVDRLINLTYLLIKKPILGVGTTGSARALIGSMLGADIVKNEITAHAIGTLAIFPEANTIFEIGGQDSKIILLENGIVTDYAMNTLCAAGTGAFLSSQAQRLGLQIQDFGAMALSSENPAKIAARCTVFAESDLVHKAQIGYRREDIVAGLCNAVAANYLNNVGKGKRIKPPIVFQGGVSKNPGVVRALENATGEKILVYPEGHLMGALGAAILAKKAGGNRRFEFKIADFDFETRGHECGRCPNNCEIMCLYKNGVLIDTWGNKCENGEAAS